MPHLQWKESYNINYKEVDAQHKRLLDILNHLLDLIENKRPIEEIAAIFHRLCAYALEHFTLEENYLEACDYPSIEKQKADHRYFIERVLEFNDRYDPSDRKLLLEIYGFLKTWFLGHVLRSDMDYVPWVRAYFKEARIQGIIVDFEGILSHSDRQPFIGALARLSGKSLKEMERVVFGDSLYLDYQKGLIGSVPFLEELSSRCGVSLDEARLTEAFSGMHKPMNNTLDLLQELKTRFKLGLVVNSNPWHAEHIVSTSQAFRLFEAIALSFETQSLVPDHGILKAVTDQLGLMAEECLFLTSRADHADAAERLLLHGQVIQSRQDLLKLLVKYD